MELSQQFKQVFFIFKKKLQQSFTCCDLCGGDCQHYSLICQACANVLPIFHLDKVQADLLNWPAINQLLPDIHFDHLVCFSPYSAPISTWLKQLKYNGRFELAPFLAQLLAEQLNKHWLQSGSGGVPERPDVILSVPLHRKKWQSRGYNQAHLLAKSVASIVQLPYDCGGLIRQKSTVSQVEKSGKARRKNLQNAFKVTLGAEFIPHHVLLIDDVVTTGATASEIAKKLKQFGVKKVTVVAMCLSLPHVEP
jgi:ComF family protein